MSDFQEVYDLYFRDVYKYALSLSRDPQMAEEITQETFFKALKNIDSFRGQCRLYVWLCQIAKNTWITCAQKQSRTLPEGAAASLWCYLAMDPAVPMDAQEYQIETVVQFSNGLCYVEYSIPYHMISTSTDIHRTEDGAIHLIEYRPRVVWGKNEKNPKIRCKLFDIQDTIRSDTGLEVPLTAIYLGCPDKEDALLLWDKTMDLPQAEKELEEKFHITNW